MGLTRANVFPSRYLGKDDVAKPIRAVIADVRMETITGDRGDEDKAIMSFSDSSIKPMIVNSTNWETLETAYGQDTDSWIDRPVEIYVDPGIMFAGRRVGGVRVRIPAGAAIAGGTGNGAAIAGGTGNGAAPAGPPLLTWADAVALAAGGGVDRDVLVAGLKARGRFGYNAARDSAAVREIVAAQSAGETPIDDDIPF